MSLTSCFADTDFWAAQIAGMADFSEVRLGANEYRPMGLARRLGIDRDTVRRWIRAGWVTTRRDQDGHRVIWADRSELRRLKQLPDLPRNWANKAQLAKLTKPKPRPAR